MAPIEKHTVRLPDHVKTEIVSHAREGKPEEVCGVIRGRGLEAYEAIRGRNIAADRIENYDVDPQTLLLQFDFEDSGDEMMGIYHSHPVSMAYPSATDAWNANYPDSIYFICSLEDDEAPVIRAYRMTPHFLELDVASLRKENRFFETRPGLFAYFQAEGTPLLGAMAGIAAEVTPPFYIVYTRGGSADQSPESRVVSLTELAISTD